MRTDQIRFKSRQLTLLLPIVLLMACTEKKTQEVPVGKVKQGTIFQDIYESGELEAIQSVNITSPNLSSRYGSMKLTMIVKDGAIVKTGDTLVQFDPAEVRKMIVEAEARVEMTKADLVKLKAQQESDLEGLKADYEVSKISQEISKIQFESAGYEADIKRREIKLNLDKADIALQKAKEQIDNTIKVQKEEIRQKELSIENDNKRLRDAYETLDLLCLRAPSPGIAIIGKNWNSGNKFQVGDQTYSGYTMVMLPDMSKLKATINVNEVDVSKISKGQKVEIKPDAFSDSVYIGEVQSVANLAINKDGNSRIKVFPVEIVLKTGSADLLPGMTVSCRVLVNRLDSVVYVPVEAVKSDGIEDFVYKKKAGGFDKVTVETATGNTDYAVITKGLKPGDVVALADPFIQDKETKKQKPQKP